MLLILIELSFVSECIDGNDGRTLVRVPIMDVPGGVGSYMLGNECT